MTLAELRALAARVGFSDPRLAAAVAYAESKGDPLARNVTAIEASYGLWQVNVRAHPEYDAASLGDPLYNAQAALTLSRTARGWGHWSTFTDGSYLAYMGDAS
jgi:hypothetical protein